MTIDLKNVFENLNGGRAITVALPHGGSLDMRPAINQQGGMQYIVDVSKASPMSDITGHQLCGHALGTELSPHIDSYQFGHTQVTQLLRRLPGMINLTRR